MPSSSKVTLEGERILSVFRYFFEASTLQCLLVQVQKKDTVGHDEMIDSGIPIESRDVHVLAMVEREIVHAYFHDNSLLRKIGARSDSTVKP